MGWQPRKGWLWWPGTGPRCCAHEGVLFWGATWPLYGLHVLLGL